MPKAIKTKRIRPLSWSRFLTRNLLVSSRVLGKRHEFKFEKHNVEVALPNPDIAEVAEEPSMLSQAEKYRVAIAGRSTDDQNMPTRIAIESADIVIQLPMKVEIDLRMLETPPNRPEFAGEEQVQELNALSEEYSNLASRAFEYWLRVMRWKSEDPTIGRPAIRGFESGWSTYLVSPKSRTRFWAGPLAFDIVVKDPIDIRTWNEVEKALNQSLEPPLYYNYLFDSIEHSKTDDLPQAVVELSTSSELFIRTKTMQAVSIDLLPVMRDYLDEANIRFVMRKFFLELLSKKGAKYFKRISSSLHALFNDRNTILHSGRKEDLSRDEFLRYLDATRKLIHMADDEEYWH